MRRKNILSLVLILGLLLTACSADPTASEQYRELEQQLAGIEQELAAVTAERDALAATAGESSERYEKSLATQEAVDDILNDPTSYGSEEDIVELLASYATEDAVMDDAVFGAVPIKNAWYYTLYGGTMDSEIDNYYKWLSDDGSQGGALWLWHGTNQAGNPFELAGINLDEYDENGVISYAFVVYPYPDDYVREAVSGSGTAQALGKESSGPASEEFVFGEDDLCEWLTEDTVAEAVSAAFDSTDAAWEGVAAIDDERSNTQNCVWLLTSESTPGINGEVWVGGSEDWIDRSSEDVIDYSGDDPMMDAFISGYPGMNDGVLVRADAFGSYAFWVEDTDRAISMRVDLLSELGEGGIEQTIVFAGSILEELNWTG